MADKGCEEEKDASCDDGEEEYGEDEDGGEDDDEEEPKGGSAGKKLHTIASKDYHTMTSAVWRTRLRRKTPEKRQIKKMQATIGVKLRMGLQETREMWRRRTKAKAQTVTTLKRNWIWNIAKRRRRMHSNTLQREHAEDSMHSCFAHANGGGGVGGGRGRLKGFNHVVIKEK